MRRSPAKTLRWDRPPAGAYPGKQQQQRRGEQREQRRGEFGKLREFRRQFRRKLGQFGGRLVEFGSQQQQR
jgi:hypothetical protein